LSLGLPSGTFSPDQAKSRTPDRNFWHTPPANTLFLHRKLGGLYLLAARLKARVDVQKMAANFLSTATDPITVATCH
jgi:hypothetical protein